MDLIYFKEFRIQFYAKKAIVLIPIAQGPWELRPFGVGFPITQSPPSLHWNIMLNLHIYNESA
jgi:hypothetical protein